MAASRSSETRITVMTATEALRAYNRYLDDWTHAAWLAPSFHEWKSHKNIQLTGDEEKRS